MSSFLPAALSATALILLQALGWSQGPAANEEREAAGTAQAASADVAALEASFEAQLEGLQRDFEARLAELERRLADDEREMRARDALFSKLIIDNTSSDQAFKQSLEGKWYERIGLRGYTQFRFTSLFGKDLTPDLVVPPDSSVSENETLLLRRGRFIFSGDVSEHLFVYVQPDFNASVGGYG